MVAGLFLIGFGNGTWDVAMNVQGAAVEQRLGRAIMPRFHAGFSIGTVAGRLGGAGMVALDLPVTVHLLVVAWRFAAASSRPRAARFPARAPPRTPEAADPADRPPHPLTAWREPRTLLIGLSCFAWRSPRAPGNDWLASP